MTSLGIERLGRVLVLTLMRPSHANSFDTELVSRMHEALDDVEHDEEVGAIVLTGTGSNFCAGSDMREEDRPPGWLDRIKQLFDRLEASRRPSIGAVNGPAIAGGCELALALDLRVASTAATFGFPEVTFGGLAFAGGTQRLARLVGPARAKELLLTGDAIDAEEAMRIGLVNRVVPRGTEVEAAVALATRIASHSSTSVRLAKWLIDNGRSMGDRTAGEAEALIGNLVVMPNLPVHPLAADSGPGILPIDR